MRAKTVRKPYRILSPEVWAEIRRQYIAGISPAEICRRFGVPRSTLTTRRSAEGWDTQREQLKAIRHRLDSSGAAADEQHKVGQEGSDARLPHSRADHGERLYARAPMASGDDVRTCRADTPPSGTGALQDAYREFAGVMNLLVELMVSDEALWTASGSRPSRNILEAAKALEKLQRVERAALGLDERSSSGRTSGVIVLPAKLTVEEWQAQVRSRPEGDVDELEE